MKTKGWVVVFALAIAGVVACAATDSPTATTTTSSDATVPAVFTHFSSKVEISRDGDYVVLRTDDIPAHSSPYFDSSDPRWEAYDGSNPDFQLNPDRIRTQELTFRIPANPSEDAQHTPTPLGPIGITVTGVAIFNQYNGVNRPLSVEINSFDQYNGHPQQTGVYHYHKEPLYITATQGKDALVGFLLDGYPVYGPEEGGKLLSDDDLDEYHGHFGPTKDYPNGIYHYHITADDPYINGSGFFGHAGTVSG